MDLDLSSLRNAVGSLEAVLCEVADAFLSMALRADGPWPSKSFGLSIPGGDFISRRAVDRKSEAFIGSLTPIQAQTMRAGAIQHFELTYELCWKFMRRWLRANVSVEDVEGVTRRHLFRLAAEQHLVDDVDRWMIFHRARNQTSHIYDEAVARDVLDSAVAFLPEAKKLLEALDRRNG